MANYNLEQYADAVEFAKRAVQEMPNSLQLRLLLVQSLARHGDIEEAREGMKTILAMRPEISASTVMRMLAQPDPVRRQRTLDHLLIAGLPDDRQ